MCAIVAVLVWLASNPLRAGTDPLQAAFERCRSRATDPLIEVPRYTSESIRKLQRCDVSECGPRPGMPTGLCSDGVSKKGLGPCVRFPEGRCGWARLSCPDDPVVKPWRASEKICEALVSPAPSMRMSGAKGVKGLLEQGGDPKALQSQFGELLTLNLKHPSDDVRREMLAVLSVFDASYVPAYQEALKRQEERRAKFRAEQQAHRAAAQQNQGESSEKVRRGGDATQQKDGIRQGPVAIPKRHGCPSVPPGPLVPLPTGVGYRIVLTVFDYLTLKPVAKVPVQLTHDKTCNMDRRCHYTHTHPESELQLSKVTGESGRVVFRVPDLSYGYYLPPNDVSGYLTFSAYYKLGSKECHPLVGKHYSKDSRTLGFDVFLVPTSMLAVRNREEAIEAAHRNTELAAWRRSNPDAELTVTGGGTAWQVGYGYGTRLKRLVNVNAFDATTGIIGRWR